MRLSANLGFLWTDLSLPDAIRAAGRAGFDAVECHFPYATDPAEVAAALTDANLPMLALNTDKSDGMGVAARPDRADEARDLIDQAIKYATQVGAKMVHMMAGFAQGVDADAAFLASLHYAVSRAETANLTILIEPLNPFDAPGYYLNSTAQAADIIQNIGSPRLKLMFDFYHVQIVEGDLTRRLTNLLPIIGHVQIAGVPDRDEPDHGELNYPHLLCHLQSLGYQGDVGAEYRPKTPVEAGLGWLPAIRAAVRPLAE